MGEMKDSAEYIDNRPEPSRERGGTRSCDGRRGDDG